jgi:hypothetical protein
VDLLAEVGGERRSAAEGREETSSLKNP